MIHPYPQVGWDDILHTGCGFNYTVVILDVEEHMVLKIQGRKKESWHFGVLDALVESGTKYFVCVPEVI